jgi:hypothetical protein
MAPSKSVRHALLGLGQRDRSASELGHTAIPGAESRIKLRLRLFQLLFRLLDQGMRHSGCLNCGPKASMHRPVISIKRGNEIVWHRRPFTIAGLIAGETGQTGAAAAIVTPRLVRMGLARPTAIMAALAFNYGPTVAGCHTQPRLVNTRQWSWSKRATSVLQSGQR